MTVIKLAYSKIQHVQFEIDQAILQGSCACRPPLITTDMPISQEVRKQACKRNLYTKYNRQTAPESEISQKGPTASQKPPAKLNMWDADKDMHLQQNKMDSDCSIRLGTTENTQNVGQQTPHQSHTDKQYTSTRKKKVTGAYTLLQHFDKSDKECHGVHHRARCAQADYTPKEDMHCCVD